MYEHPIVEDLIINITDKCNLNCAHCFKEGSGSNELSVQDIRHIIENAIKYGLKRVDFSGGECLIHPQLYDLIQLCIQFPSICFGFITNGLFLTKEILDEISKINNSYVQISIDGASEENYERVRGKGTYEQLMAALDILKHHPIKDKRSRTVINSANYSEIEDIFLLCMDHKIEPSFLFTAEEGNAIENWEWLNISDIKKIHANNIISQLNKKYNTHVGLISPGGGCDLTNGRERKTFVVGADGMVFFCDLLLDYPLGNIKKSDFKSILQGEPLQKLYEKENERKKAMKDNCEKCQIFNECHFGCPREVREDNYSQCKYKKMYFACYINQFL